VTAVSDSKVYDGTTSSTGTPSIGPGSIAVGDFANFSQHFDTKDVGTGKTLIPAGSVTDGNSGNNYDVTFVNDTTGQITARALTVSAAGVRRTFSGSRRSRTRPAAPAARQRAAAAGQSASGSFWRTKAPRTGPTIQPICHDWLENAR